MTAAALPERATATPRREAPGARRLAITMLWAIVAAQAWPWLAAPLLPFEDGTLLFARSYAHFDLADCFASYAGYVAFGGNLLAALCCRLPSPYIASSFAVAAASMTALAATAILHPAWQRIAPFGVRLAISLAVLLPLGNYLLLTSVAYSQWAMLLWLVLRMLHPERRQGAARYLDFVLVAALGWSHPLAVLLMPLMALSSLRRVDMARWWVLLLSLFGYWLLVLNRAPLDVQQVAGSRAGVLFETLLHRVVVEACIGDAARGWLQSWGGAAVVTATGVLLTAMLVVMVTLALRRAGVEVRAMLLACCWLGIAVPVASVLSRSAAAGQFGWVVRYVWIGRVALLVIVAGLAAADLGARRTVAGLLVLGCCLWLSNRGFYHHADGAQFVVMLGEELARQEQRPGGRAAIELVLPRTNGSIVLRPR